MRIIGNIEHPFLKISVFKADHRVTVKFENALYEQSIKFGDDDRFSNLDAIRQLVDDKLLLDILEGFRQLHAARISAMKRSFPSDTSQEFEEII
ncbi:MAG: hypothetical protein RIQ78_102 [Bacteroidota bacterium]|jgi:hypothetical protein